MKRSFYTLLILATLALVLVISGTGCAKKVAPPPAPKTEAPPPPPPPPPTPTLSLSASPSAIQTGQSTTLSWNSSNATSVTIDNGVGTVEASGTRSVTPSASTTYVARATGPGGNATAEARVTVTAPPPPPPPPPPPAISDSEFFSKNIKDALFDYDKYDIREDARAALTGDAGALSQRPGIRFTIEGHCDERGSEKYNLALGDRRANAAKEFLVSQGVDGSRMDTISYGKEKPFCEEHNEACWQQNRRAHLVIK